VIASKPVLPRKKFAVLIHTGFSRVIGSIARTGNRLNGIDLLDSSNGRAFVWIGFVFV